MAEGEANPTDPEVTWQFKPGDTVAPAGAAPAPVSAPEPSANEPEPAAPEPLAPNATAIPPEGPEGSITWTASEFVAHQKSALWYVAVVAASVIAAAIVWLLTKDKISAAVVVVGAVIFAGYGARKPQQLEYRLDENGLAIGQRRFSYHQFRSFSIIPEGAFNSIAFMPLKRFSPLTTIYYDPADEPKITALLNQQLPYEERQKDLIDRLMWRIRF